MNDQLRIKYDNALFLRDKKLKINSICYGLFLALKESITSLKRRKNNKRFQNTSKQNE
jgi:hypothetical protein